MPLSKYFKGHGEDVMHSMKKKYGEKKGESVFYATAHKKGLGPSEHVIERHEKRGKKK